MNAARKIGALGALGAMTLASAAWASSTGEVTRLQVNQLLARDPTPVRPASGPPRDLHAAWVLALQDFPAEVNEMLKVLEFRLLACPSMAVALGVGVATLEAAGHACVAIALGDDATTRLMRAVLARQAAEAPPFGARAAEASQRTHAVAGELVQRAFHNDEILCNEAAWKYTLLLEALEISPALSIEQRAAAAAQRERFVKVFEFFDARSVTQPRLWWDPKTTPPPARFGPGFEDTPGMDDAL